jgi:hypothetical protein
MATSSVFVAPARNEAIRCETVSADWPPSVRK